MNPAFLAAHTSNYDAFAAFVAPFTPAHTAATLHRLVDIIATRERVSFGWTMGVNQSPEATHTAQAIINLAPVAGTIGRPGTGANSSARQRNAMDSRFFGHATSLLGGGDPANAAHRAHVAATLGLDPALIPDRSGAAHNQILDAIARGEIRGRWVIATNTAHSWINQSRVRDLLATLDFLVVQERDVTTGTAQLAGVVLPAAGWGGKDGILINRERHLVVARKVSRARGQALSDFAIFRFVAEAWGCGDRLRAWSSPEATLQILQKLSAGQPCDCGTAQAIALVTPTVQPGQILRPIHFGTVNQRTFPSFDPHSRQPSYKACALAVDRV